ncbi:hypothetical protein DL98DRAFT_36787 [Cadophora sp. DSE1049]|nr:hypothetical protein DL98DRAFT_36787 [Cadophora sp. DSE1049]
MATSNAIITGHRDFVPPATTLLSTAFLTDPTMTYILSSLSESERPAYLPIYFKTLLTAATLNGASISCITNAESGEWDSCGVLMPQDADVGNMWTAVQAGWLGVLWKLGWRGYQRMAIETAGLTEACKREALAKDEKYYYIFFLGTLPSSRGKGHCSHLIKYYQSLAAQEGVPIWLEAATEYCWRLYLRLGFVTVQELRLAEGKADETGRQCEGGKGVRLWGMIWRPEYGKVGGEDGGSD